MARKRITSVRRDPGGAAVARVTWLEDGAMFPHDDPHDKIVRAINAGEAFYLRGPGDVDVAVTVQVRHGKSTLKAQPDAAAPDLLLSLPTY